MLTNMWIQIIQVVQHGQPPQDTQGAVTCLLPRSNTDLDRQRGGSQTHGAATWIRHGSRLGCDQVRL